MRHELLQLMMRFRLCYRLEGTETHIAPQLLRAARPSYAWDARANLSLEYRYEFMPKGILTLLIVGLHQDIDSQSLVWRTGVVLARDGTRCEVLEDYPRRRIVVRAAGERPRELLAIVDHDSRGSTGASVNSKWRPGCPVAVRSAAPTASRTSSASMRSGASRGRERGSSARRAAIWSTPDSSSTRFCPATMMTGCAIRMWAALGRSPRRP